MFSNKISNDLTSHGVVMHRYNCIKPVLLQVSEQAFYVKCGQCALCVSSWRSRRVLQMTLESKTFSKTAFLTLTYDDDNLARINNEPCLDDHQRFMKRLRVRLDRLGYGKIRFVVVSERGKRGTCRVHYHYIIYGLGYGAFEKKLIQECWPFGFIKLKPVANSFSYVMKYVLKGVEKDGSVDSLKHFYTYSRSTGFGFDYVKEKASFFLNQVKHGKSMQVVIKGSKFFLPKNLVFNVLGRCKDKLQEYYCNLFKKIDSLYDANVIKLGFDISSKEYSNYCVDTVFQKIKNIYARRLRYG